MKKIYKLFAFLVVMQSKSLVFQDSLEGFLHRVVEKESVKKVSWQLSPYRKADLTDYLKTSVQVAISQVQTSAEDKNAVIINFLVNKYSRLKNT